MTHYHSAVKYVVGAAFGYPLRLEVGPRGDGFEWRVDMLNQGVDGDG